MQNKSRATRLRLRLYAEFGYGGVTAAARGIEMDRAHVSLVLNEQRASDNVLDKIEAWLDERQVTEEAHV